MPKIEKERRDKSQTPSENNFDVHLAPSAAASLINTTPRTLARWEALDPPLITAYRLPNGERRYRRGDVLKLLSSSWVPRAQKLEQAKLARAALAEARKKQALTSQRN